MCDVELIVWSLSMLLWPNRALSGFVKNPSHFLSIYRTSMFTWQTFHFDLWLITRFYVSNWPIACFPFYLMHTYFKWMAKCARDSIWICSFFAFHSFFLFSMCFRWPFHYWQMKINNKLADRLNYRPKPFNLPLFLSCYFPYNLRLCTSKFVGVATHSHMWGQC